MTTDYVGEFYKLTIELRDKVKESSSGSIKPDFNIFAGATQAEMEPFRRAMSELIQTHNIMFYTSNDFEVGITIGWSPIPGYPFTKEDAHEEDST